MGVNGTPVGPPPIKPPPPPPPPPPQEGGLDLVIAERYMRRHGLVRPWLART